MPSRNPQSPGLKLGVIADDFTGGTDMAGFLVKGGLSTIQFGGLPQPGTAIEAEAAVISLKSRSCPPEEAIALSLAALDSLRARGCRGCSVNSCSSFDSTPRGNIGPVTEALMAALGEDFTVICPALPQNGRTVYNGYLFVGPVLLNESGMRHHPVNPMLDANLMRLMEAQAPGRAANLPWTVIDQGPEVVTAILEALRREGIRYAAPDVLREEHLLTLGRALADFPLLTGGSGLGYGLARCLADGDGVDEAQAAAAGAPPDGGRTVALSGSCSVMTNSQVAAYARVAPRLVIDAARCLSDAVAYAREAAAWATKQSSHLAPLISATTGPEILAETQKRFGAEKLAAAVETFFAALAKHLRAEGFDHFIVAGGETSGAVMQSLGAAALRIGPEIAPGVPWVRAVDAPLSFALKSGNFGDENFFTHAQSFYTSQ
ncbi:MAG: four-carbon acid sugar kinase family protein [Candidatus Adiutrix sp.]|jgi:uncharacterized protein YgbK (DUF1537 family)|nr:four-carbon acid sugar kinase family protein [Candidatus Adiutrix sp.]